MNNINNNNKTKTNSQSLIGSMAVHILSVLCAVVISLNENITLTSCDHKLLYR